MSCMRSLWNRVGYDIYIIWLLEYHCILVPYISLHNILSKHLNTLHLLHTHIIYVWPSANLGSPHLSSDLIPGYSYSCSLSSSSLFSLQCVTCKHILSFHKSFVYPFPVSWYKFMLVFGLPVYIYISHQSKCQNNFSSLQLHKMMPVVKLYGFPPTILLHL